MLSLPWLTRLPLFAPDEPPAGGEPAPAPAPDGGGATAPEPGAPAPEPGAPADSTRDTYTRSEYEAIQREAKNLREKYVPYRDAFDGYQEDDAKAWLWLAQEYKTNPQGAIEAMERLVQAEKANAQPAPDADKPLTRAEYDKLRQEEAQQTEQQRLVSDIQQEARDLGYKDNTIEMSDLFFIAQNETNGDLKAAHAKVQAREQEIIDRYVAKKREEAGVSPRVPHGGGAPGEKETGPKTFEEARAAMEERYRHL